MARDWSELLGRIQFARHEIDRLEAEVGLYGDGALAYRSVPTPGRNTSDVLARVVRPVPVSIRARAGTTANELRTILDGLASDLAIEHSGSSEQVYFPISKSEEAFQKDGRKKIAKLSPGDQATIAGLSPYREANPTLFALHEADRTRKHYRLGACIADISKNTIPFFATLGPGSRVLSGRVNDILIEDMSFPLVKDMSGPAGSEFLVASGVPDNLPIQFEVAVSYLEPAELSGQPIVRTMRKFADLVEAIVRLF